MRHPAALECSSLIRLSCAMVAQFSGEQEEAVDGHIETPTTMVGSLTGSFAFGYVAATSRYAATR